MRTDWKAYFNFSKKDRVGAVVILILMVCITIAILFYHPAHQPVTITTLDQELAKESIDTASAADEPLAYVPSSEETEVTNSSAAELFTFDPNTLDAAGFKRLGLQDKTINTILKYRSKGGHFYKADDLRKIYGLRKEDADRLTPYVQITGAQQTFTKTEKSPVYTKPATAVININTATAEQWKTLPAIGEVLANRIVKFRDKTGGFTSVAQVKQTYGLSDSAFKAIEPYLTITAAPQQMNATSNQQTAATEKININTASVNQLKSNPHIPEEVAQAIVIYRSQHGNFSTVEDIKKIVFINDELFKQISPYLTVQ